MVNPAIENQLRGELDRLPPEKQQEVLDFARRLNGKLPPGTSGTSLIRFAGAISREDLRDMQQAIEDACERIDPNAW